MNMPKQPTPFQDALDKIPANQVFIEGGASQTDGAGIHGSIEHGKGGTSFGAVGGISEKKGWRIAGFFKHIWK